MGLQCLGSIRFIAGSTSASGLAAWRTGGDGCSQDPFWPALSGVSAASLLGKEGPRNCSPCTCYIQTQVLQCGHWHETYNCFRMQLRICWWESVGSNSLGTFFVSYTGSRIPFCSHFKVLTITYNAVYDLGHGNVKDCLLGYLPTCAFQCSKGALLVSSAG